MSACPTSAWASVHNPCHAPPQVLVLAWADNRKDLEVVWKVLSQVCLAYRSDGGRVVVVLSSRDKLVRAFHCHSNSAVQQTPQRAADWDLPLSLIHLKLFWVLPLGCGAVLPLQARASTCLSSEFKLLSLMHPVPPACPCSASFWAHLHRGVSEQHKNLIWGWCNYLTSACACCRITPRLCCTQEMEELFRRTIPEDSRYGTQFVFRQVSRRQAGCFAKLGRLVLITDNPSAAVCKRL